MSLILGLGISLVGMENFSRGKKIFLPWDMNIFPTGEMLWHNEYLSVVSKAYV